MDSCDLAANFADRLMKARDMAELGQISSEVRARTHDLGEMLPWLRDIYASALKGLNNPPKPMEEYLNESGKKWLKKQEASDGKV
jgi:hypothetical protein